MPAWYCVHRAERANKGSQCQSQHASPPSRSFLCLRTARHLGYTHHPRPRHARGRASACRATTQTLIAASTAGCNLPAICCEEWAGEPQRVPAAVVCGTAPLPSSSQELAHEETCCHCLGTRTGHLWHHVGDRVRAAEIRQRQLQSRSGSKQIYPRRHLGVLVPNV